ncbi:hypothetical protein EXN66_Car000198 [Channa argus]|uniref:Uncharacterized protein n=1 Tax=Channa argus TaxID=215402 RepID=A0A6G1QY75_CHAAH|nr:hypothetical protein EXN66_Car000198 [Channa argus]
MRVYVRSIPLCECLCSEFSLAQKKRTNEGLGPVLAGQRGSAHRTDMKLSGFIRQRRGTRDDNYGDSTRSLLGLTQLELPRHKLIPERDLERRR